MRLNFSLRRRVLVMVMGLLSHVTYAMPVDCELLLQAINPVTAKALREKNTERLRAVEAIYPKLGFTYPASEIQKFNPGVDGPRALREMAPRYQFVMTPAPSAPMDTAVNLHQENRSFPVQTTFEWFGKKSTTVVYASMPKTLRPQKSGRLVSSRDYKLVLVHLHGGATPTATGKNGMSVGEALAQLGFPVLAMDLPGHGQGPRQLEGMTSMQDQVDWILKVVDELADPDVKISISGHSWGGEFALFMQRHSNDPKYQRIVEFLALSPPIDPTLGGDEESKARFEEELEARFHELEPFIAPQDFDFHNNLLRNGKIAIYAGLFTKLTAMDYLTPPYTVEEQVGLKPLTVVVGSADGMVYVGREDAFRRVFANLVAPSQFIIFGPGQTWKTDNTGATYETGHNIWDLRIEGSRKLRAYTLISDHLSSFADPSTFGADTADEAELKVSEVYRNFANFFMFREMLKAAPEYISTSTAERRELLARKGELDSYIQRVTAHEEASRKAAEQSTQKALEEIRLKLGILDPLTLERADEELQVGQMSAARRAQLATYLASVDRIDEEVRKLPPDPKIALDLAALEKEFAAPLKALGIDNFNDYKPRYDALMAIKSSKLTAKEKDDRTTLGRLHQKYCDMQKTAQRRLADRLLEVQKTIPKPEGIVDLKQVLRQLKFEGTPERLYKLNEFIELGRQREAFIRADFEQKLQATLAADSKPAGVANPGEGRTLKDRQDKIMEMLYAPDDAPEVQHLTDNIKVLVREREDLAKSLPNEKWVKEKLGERSASMKIWESRWKSGALSSRQLQAAYADVESKLEHYTELYHQYDRAASAILRRLKMNQQLTEQNILAALAPIEPQLDTMIQAKIDFEIASKRVEPLKWEEAIAGNLLGPEGDVAAATQAAWTLWGSAYSLENPGGLMGEVRDIEAKIEEYRRQDSIRDQAIHKMQAEYSQKMLALGQPIPVVMHEVSIVDALNLPYAELIARLRTDSVLKDAFKAALDRWQVYVGQLRVESQTKDPGNN